MVDTILVIARYMEDLEWIKDEKYNQYPYIVYNKGSDENYCKTDKFIKEIKLPNVGRETHTYFYHIIQNYDRLNEMTIFLPGSMELHHKDVKGKALMDQLKLTPTTPIYVCDRELAGIPVYEIHKDLALYTYRSSNKRNLMNNQEFYLEPSRIRPFGLWYTYHFNTNIPNTYTTYNAIFALSRQLIRAKCIDYYKFLLTEVNYHHNHETVHYYERAWYAVFYDENIPTLAVYTSFTD